MDADQQTVAAPECESAAAASEIRTGPLVSPAAEMQYRCPGEAHAISRPIHLSRLAAFYPACRQCQHRHDTGQLPPRTVELIQRVERRVPQHSVFRTNGVRGVYQNELTPALAGRIASAFAAVLWERVPLAGRVGPVRNAGPTRRGPAFVCGYDERPSSPAILASVIDALKRMGCPVTDVGLVSRPSFAFAVDHLQAAAGIFVTGSGHDASWAGLDLIEEGGIPMSLGTGLEQIEKRLSDGVTRPTRRAAFQQAFQVAVPYEAGLWKLLHALRPLRVVCAARPRPVRRTLRTLFQQLPCELLEIKSLTAQSEIIRPEVLTRKIQSRVVDRKAHLGVLIDDDGASCRFIDERGRLIDKSRISCCLADFVHSEHPAAAVVGESSTTEAISRSGRLNVQDGGETHGSLAQSMRDSRAVFGCGNDDRYWFRESYPACDGIRTLAWILQTLSRSDRPFSQVAAE